MRAVLCLAALSIASCYNPNYDLTPYKCALGGECPGGFECVLGTCRRSDSLDAGQGDMSVSLPPFDMGHSPADMKKKEDMRAEGCKGDGFSVTPANDVYACQGPFDVGHFGDLCADGFHVCFKEDDGALMQVMDTACRAVSGFFAASISGGLDANNKFTCDTNFGQSNALVGCGSESRSQGQTPACHGLKSNMPCASTAPWQCNRTLDDAKYTGSAGGVLCCHDKA